MNLSSRKRRYIFLLGAITVLVLIRNALTISLHSTTQGATHGDSKVYMDDTITATAGVNTDLRTTLTTEHDRKVLADIGKSVLVTGAAGFIGMHTSLELKKLGVRVVALDNMNSYYSVDLKKDRVELLKRVGVEFVKGDACDEQLLHTVIKDYSIDSVLHLASQGGVRFSLESPHSYIKTNFDCFVSVLEQFAKLDLQNKSFVYASSSSVYGINNNAPFMEDFSDVDHPVSLYAASKRSHELIEHTYNHLYNISSVGLRFFSVYGPYGRPDMSPMIFAHKILKNETLEMSNFGNNIRDFTHISDIVRGIIAALRLDSTKPHLINLGGNKPIKLTRFVRLMEEGLKKMASIQLVPMHNGDVTLTHADITKANTLLEWSPEISIEEGTRHFLDWFIAHNASKYMESPKKEVCIITANFAKEVELMDKVMNVSGYKESDRSLAFYFFSNLNLDHSKKGWENVQLSNLKYRRMITQSRWPKFMAWQRRTVEQNCKTVFYLDCSARPKGDFVKLLHSLKTEVLSSKIGFASPKHPETDRSIKEEFRAILESKKDIQKHINVSLIWLREQDDHHDDILVYQNKYFMYVPTSKNWRRLMIDCFWKRYSQELDSWRDQPLYSYCVHHFNFTPVELSSTHFSSTGRGYNQHTYTERDDKNT